MVKIEIDRAAISGAFAETLGDSVRIEETFDLGNPLTGEVEAELTEHPGMVWIHAPSGNTLAVEGEQANDSEDKVFKVRALMPRDFPPGLALYGTPVMAKSVNGLYEITGLDVLRSSEYLYGLVDRLQRAVDLSQLDFMLARPTNPPSGKIEISRSIVQFNNTAYLTPLILSSDLITTYEPTLTAGQALAVKVELDPATQTLHYLAGVAFVNAGHDESFAAYYPKTITQSYFLTVWVKIYEGITAITISDLLHAQEILNKGGGSGVGDKLYLSNHYFRNEA